MTDKTGDASASSQTATFELPRLPQEVTPVASVQADKATATPVAVFISYRAELDESLARALRDLLVGAIDPSPAVFVAGAGGLRASSDPFKIQLQGAIREAQAVLSMVTQQSKDRSWILFEAGAAWGTRKPYVPILVDVEPADLGSLLGDNQAFRANNKEQMRQVVADVARWSGGTIKSHFGKRFGPFLKVVTAYPPAMTGDTDSTDSSQTSALMDAGHLLLDGELEEARSAFDALVAKAESNDEKARIRVFQTSLDSRNDDDAKWYGAMAKLPPELKKTATFLLALADRERLAARATPQYANVAAMTQRGTTEWRRAKLGVARTCFLGRHGKEATEVLVDMLRDSDALNRRDAAMLWNEHRADDQSVGRLLVLLRGLANNSDEILSGIATIAKELRWRALALACAERRDAASNSGVARNDLGIVLESLELQSLAFDSYGRAASSGVSVARVNQAALLERGFVATAGLKLIKEHDGDFDAASPSYPFEVRGRLESAVAKEAATARQIAAAGGQLLNMLVEVADLSMQTGMSDDAPNSLSLQADVTGVPLRLLRVRPFMNAWFGSGSSINALGVRDGTQVRAAVWDSDQPTKAAEWRMLPIDETGAGRLGAEPK